jgi:hypothetical protein
MNCRTIREQLPDVALGVTPASPEVENHLAGCHECSGTVDALRATMNLLDEWKAPEPSPYWDVRMQARLREEQQKAPAGALQLFRRPMLSMAAALCLVMGVGVYQLERFMKVENPPVVHFAAPAPTGTAVADLQYLDKNSDMLQNFDALDALDGDDDAESGN